MTAIKTQVGSRDAATETRFEPTAGISATNVQLAIEEAALSGVTSWGSIAGTLADQTDLQTALDAKSDAGHVHAVADVTGLQAALDAKVDDTQVSGYGASLIDDADAATARATLGLGTMAVETAANYLTTAAAVAGYQPLDADLTAWAGVTRASGFDTFAATPNSANLRSLLSDEVGTGAAYFVGGALGTPASATLTNATGLPLTGLVSDTTTALGIGSVNLGHASDTTLARVSAGVVSIEGVNILTTATGQPLDADLTSWAGVTRASGFDTFAATPSSANLRALLSDEVGTGAAYFVGGALGTPASATLTNATGLPVSTGISGLGTGVATALAVNVGTAGAPVVNGGALGTPSSGTLTSATGLPISTGVAGLGTGVATALAVNVGTAGSPVVNGGVLGTPSSGTLTNATGLPIATGVSGLGTGIATALAVNTGSAGAPVLFNGALGTPSSGTLTNATGLPTAGLVDDAVTNAKLANMATATFKGRTTAGTGDPENLTATQATALLNVMVGDSGAGGTKGLVPAPGIGDATKFLKGDGTFASIPGGGDALTGSSLAQFAPTTSAELRGVLSDETGTGFAYFQGGDIGTPSAGVATNLTGLPLTTGVTGTLPIANGGTAGTTKAAARSALGFGTTGAGNIFGAAINLGLTASVAANALTVALKGADGNDPSATNPVLVPFRNVTAATGTPSWLSVTAASSIVVSSGSTLGTANNNEFRFWIVGFNDGGTFRMGVIQVNSATVLSAADLVSSTAEGGAGAADTIATFYTGTAVTSKAYCILGFVEYSSGLATAGTYASAPTKTQVFGPGIDAPGKSVTVQTFTGNGTWTRPAGCRQIRARAVGGGGGGGGATAAASQCAVGAGGGAGGYAEGWFDVTATPSLAITIGTAGTAGAAANGTGGTGGTTSVGALLSVPGGTGGAGVASGTAYAQTAGGVPSGTPTGGDINVNGASGTNGLRSSGTAGRGGNGGTSAMGGGGRSGGIAAVGRGGEGYGGGGGGALSLSTTAYAGGAGAAGYVIIEEFY